MTRHILAAILLLVTSAGFSLAQPGCQTIYLPDLAPPAGVPTPGIVTGFAVPPSAKTASGLFYPFTLEYRDDSSVVVTQAVGDASKVSRYWLNVRSVSLVYVTSRVYVSGSPLALYALDASGAWQPWKDSVQIIAYTTLPDNVAVPGQEPTWAYREDLRILDPLFNGNLSMPLLLGEKWNVGYWSPQGLAEANLQVKARLCQ